MTMNYKEIEDYPNYLIYRDGRVWSKKRKIFMKPRLAINKNDGRKEYRLGLCKNGKPKDFKIHRLLGIAFIYNDDPINKTQIDHIDRNSLNNDLSNLRWATWEEQQLNKGLYNNNKLGLRHILFRRNRYNVQIKRFNYDKTFKTEEEAILQRNMFLDFMGEDYLNIDK